MNAQHTKRRHFNLEFFNIQRFINFHKMLIYSSTTLMMNSWERGAHTMTHRPKKVTQSLKQLQIFSIHWIYDVEFINFIMKIWCALMWEAIVSWNLWRQMLLECFLSRCYFDLCFCFFVCCLFVSTSFTEHVNVFFTTTLYVFFSLSSLSCYALYSKHGGDVSMKHSNVCMFSVMWTA